MAALQWAQKMHRAAMGAENAPRCNGRRKCTALQWAQ
jgi:hypothetical protein